MINQTEIGKKYFDLTTKVTEALMKFYQTGSQKRYDDC